MSNTTYQISNSFSPEQIAQIMGPYSVILFILSIIVSILLIIAEWKLFKKAGYIGWECLIPIYNVFKLTEIACGNGWMFLLLLIPFVNFIFIIWLYIQLAKAFGQSGLFAFGLIIMTSIFVMILGFGDAQYVGPKGIAKNSQEI